MSGVRTLPLEPGEPPINYPIERRMPRLPPLSVDEINRMRDAWDRRPLPQEMPFETLWRPQDVISDQPTSQEYGPYYIKRQL